MVHLCLDFEGVLIPEIWQCLAKEVNSDDLMLTTQDLKDYDELMSLRMKVVNEKNIKLSDIQKIVRDIDPFDGAQEFLDWARSKFQVTIVSDTFYELAWPLVEKLGYPSIICHNMTVENDKITGYKLRQSNNKQKVIEALQSLKFKVFASGDSYNDINMLNTADLGIFFQAPRHIKEEYPHLLTASSHNELKKILEEHL
jgi:phosphoserine/homoserine phosphotransferase